MKSILIIATNSLLEEKLQDHLHSIGEGDSYSVSTTASFGQGGNWWLNEGPHLLIIMMPSEPILQSFFIKKMIKDLPRFLPVIFIAEEVSASFMQISTAFKKVRALKSPVVIPALYNNVHELLLARPPEQQQRHQRYEVSLRAIMYTAQGQERSFEVELKNLSLGGAFLEILGAGYEFLKPGDPVQIEIGDEQAGQKHLFEAEVVWSKEEDGMGVKFTHSPKPVKG